MQTLAEEAHEDVEPDLTKAEASKEIDRLRAKTGRGRRTAPKRVPKTSRRFLNIRAAAAVAWWHNISRGLASPLDPPCRGVGACVGGDAGAGVTREYQAALLQLVRSSDQEIAQRKTSARRFYGIAAGEDEGRFLAQLRAVEPSNAETLAAAFDRQRSLRAS